MPVIIHGKQYNTVAERITKAGDELLEVTTEVLFTEPVVIKATIKTKKGIFTGISAANASKQIEKENPYEVAETSAVGRALAFAGYETSNGIASAEEMYKSERESTVKTIIRDEVVREPIETNKHICSVCGKVLVFKTGTTKEGKKYEGYFCPTKDDKKHDVKLFKYL